MARDDENDIEYDAANDDEFSLESILAEYKGSAYIDGDKRTPSEILEARTEKILDEIEKSALGESKQDTEAEGVSQDVEEQDEAGTPEKRKNRKKKNINREDFDGSDYFAEVDKKYAGEENDFFADIRDASDIEEPQKKETPQHEGLNKKFAEAKPNNGNRKVSIHINDREIDRLNEENRRNTEPEASKKPDDRSSDNVVKFSDFSQNEKKDAGDEFFDSYGYASPGAVKENSEKVQETIERGESLEEEESKTKKRWFFAPKEPPEIDEEDEAEEELFEEELPEEEPDYLEESKRFAKGIRFLSLRAVFAFVVCVFMLIFTFVSESGGQVPFGIGTDKVLLSGVMMIMMLIVMLLGADILVSGAEDLFSGQPGAESMILAASFVTVLSSALAMLSGKLDIAIPFCVIPACSMFFAIRGRKYYKMAMCDSLRTAIATSSPYGVVSEYGSLGERSVLKKVTTTTEGFYRRLSQADISEDVFSILSPLLMIMSLVLSLLATVGKGDGGNFGVAFGAMLSVSASFSALLSYNMPFKFVSQMAKKSGGAIAGWGGAAEIFDADGALITDEDIFPTGTLSVSGIKLFEGVPQNKAIAYTSSLVIASGSDLSRTFAELMKTQRLDILHIDEFACYEGGGVGGIIHGERVMIGTSGFMNLMGIRVPENVKIKNSIFTSVNDELIGVFTINYVPANSVQGAIVSMLKTRVNMIFALRDFNITPMMLQQKFKVSMKKIETIPIEDCYRVSQGEPLYDSDAVAVLCREGLGPFAEVVTRGRQLKIISHLATVLTAIGSVFGMLLIFFLCWKGAYDAVSPGNAFIFMIAIHFVIAIIARFAKRRS